jgi:hypothetical protein
MTMHYTQFSNSTDQKIILDVKCEACEREYQVRGKWKAVSLAQVGGRVSSADNSTRQYLNNGLVKTIEWKKKAILDGVINDGISNPVIFEPSLESWRCPNCNYAQSWMIKLFHLSWKKILLTYAVLFLAVFLGTLILAITKAPPVFLYGFLGIFVIALFITISLVTFWPWLIKHPNQNWFAAHNKTRKEAPPARKPVKVEFE